MDIFSCHTLALSRRSRLFNATMVHDSRRCYFFLQDSSQSLFGADLDSEGPPTLTPEVPSDLFAHSGPECAASSYSNMEEVD